MAIILRCEACHKEGHLPEEMAGKRVKCRACGQVQLCPSGSTKAVVEAKKAPAPAKGIDFPHFEPPALTSRTTKGDRRSARARAEDDKEVGKPANSRLVLVVASSVLGRF